MVGVAAQQAESENNLIRFLSASEMDTPMESKESLVSDEIAKALCDSGDKIPVDMLRSLAR